MIVLNEGEKMGWFSNILLIVMSICAICIGTHTIITEEIVLKGGYILRGGGAIFFGIVYILLGIYIFYLAVSLIREKKKDKKIPP
jgi:hypothetical protein